MTAFGQHHAASNSGRGFSRLRAMRSLCLCLLLPIAGTPLLATFATQMPFAETPLRTMLIEEAVADGFAELDEVNRDAPQDTMVTEGEQGLFRKILWYLPNRVIDLIDIVKFDVGAGGGLGAVLRVTRYGQMGGRYIEPLSARAGIRGREFPVFFERESEYGFCANFEQSSTRSVTPLELGIGADLGVGVYAGVSLDEIADFFLGFFLLDLKHDDLVPMIEPS